jgi:hypothetical protein
VLNNDTKAICGLYCDTNNKKKRNEKTKVETLQAIMRGGIRGGGRESTRENQRFASRRRLLLSEIELLLHATAAGAS